MFAWIVPGKIVGCWETMEILERRVGVCRCLISIPPRVTVESPVFEIGASYRERSSDAMVDLPDPERPTTAVQEPCGMVMETSSRMSVHGRDGYRKLTLVS